MKARVSHLSFGTNKTKESKLEATHAEYVKYIKICVTKLIFDKRFHVIPSEKRTYFPTSEILSSQIIKNAQSQAINMIDTWIAGSYNRMLKQHIDSFQFSDHQLMELRCIGKYKLTRSGKFGKGTISQEMINLYWSWVWDSTINGNPPEVRDTLPMWMTETTCDFRPSSKSSRFGWWINISTLENGRRTKLPLETTPFLNKNLAKSIMVRKVDGRWAFQFTDKQEVPEPIGDQGTLGIDVGLNCLAATSDGSLYGTNFKPQFDAKYSKLQKIRANRQRQEIKKGSKRLYRLERKLSGFTKTATGTVANKLVKDYPAHTFVLEDLDLRGCKGSKRFAYRALQKNLASKAVTKVVNPAYTSQQCPSCSYVSSWNRMGTKFSCKSCGRKSHSDVVGAINLLGRSKDKKINCDDNPFKVQGILRERYRLRRNSSAKYRSKALVPSSPEATVCESTQASKDSLCL